MFIKSISLAASLTIPMFLLGCGETEKGQFTDQQICIATISQLMHQEPSIIKVKSLQNEITFLTYVRPSDGTVWSYKCGVNGNKVNWAMESGRWRNSEHDSKVTFSVEGSYVDILERYSDGSELSKKFSLDQLN